MLGRRESRNYSASEEISFQIFGFHDSDYEELRLLGCYAVWLL
jgi:hypothetical protein